MSYQVIEMYGENEPWWFFENWQEDVVAQNDFNDFEQAKAFFCEETCRLKQENEEMKEKPDFMVAFWNEDDLQFCEDCDDDLQLFRGLLLLEDGKKITANGKGPNETINHCGKAQCRTRLS